jgi:hypothetical protein
LKAPSAFTAAGAVDHVVVGIADVLWEAKGEGRWRLQIAIRRLGHAFGHQASCLVHVVLPPIHQLRNLRDTCVVPMARVPTTPAPVLVGSPLYICPERPGRFTQYTKFLDCIGRMLAAERVRRIACLSRGSRHRRLLCFDEERASVNVKRVRLRKVK